MTLSHTARRVLLAMAGYPNNTTHIVLMDWIVRDVRRSRYRVAKALKELAVASLASYDTCGWWDDYPVRLCGSGWTLTEKGYDAVANRESRIRKRLEYKRVFNTLFNASEAPP